MPAYLHDLTVVAIARVRGDGVVVEANRGLLALVSRKDMPATTWMADDLLVQPDVPALRPRPDAPDHEPLYQGVLTFRGPGQSCAAVPGKVYRSGDGWLIVAEPGWEALERLRISARQLQHELAETHQQIREEAAQRDSKAQADTARLDQMERGVAALEKILENELAALEQLVQTSPSTVTAQLYGLGLLRENVPQEFQRLVQRYGEILELALDQRAYRVAHDLPEALRALGEGIGFLGGGPRDVIEIHTTALKEKRRKAQPARMRAYVEESHLLVLELMGYLAAFYRASAVPRSRRPPPPTGDPPQERQS